MSLGVQALPEVATEIPMNIPEGAKILIVTEDGSDAEQIRALLRKGGLDAECATDITTGGETVTSGRFQAVISSPRFKDGSWRQLIAIANRYNLHFEVLLWAQNFDLQEWTEALRDGAFDVLDAIRERARAVEATKCALWSAYLKGGGPNARAVRPYKVA